MDIRSIDLDLLGVGYTIGIYWSLEPVGKSSGLGLRLGSWMIKCALRRVPLLALLITYFDCLCYSLQLYHMSCFKRSGRPASLLMDSVRDLCPSVETSV